MLGCHAYEPKCIVGNGKIVTTFIKIAPCAARRAKFYLNEHSVILERLPYAVQFVRGETVERLSSYQDYSYHHECCGLPVVRLLLILTSLEPTLMSHTTSTQLLRFDGGCSVEELRP